MIPTLDIVIVNWNAGNYLFQCIQSIHNALTPSFILKNVVVVDNASSDNSLEKISEIQLPIKIIINSDNLGFGKACNIGVHSSDSEYLLILNPDTLLFSNSIEPVIQFIQKKENNIYGMVGVKIIDDDGLISKNCARFPTPIGSICQSFGLDKLFPKVFPTHFMIEWDHKESRSVDQVMGSYIMMRRELFEKLGGYDDDYFVYYDDLDLALRAKQLGFKNYYLADALIFHKGGGTSEKVKATRLAYILHSKLIYSKKHFNKFWYVIILAVTLTLEPLARILFALAKGSMEEAKEIWSAYSKLFSKIISK